MPLQGRGKIVRWVLIFLVTALFLGSGLLVIASYSTLKLPLVGYSFQKKVDYLIASTPLIPKTAKQILTKTFEDSQKIRTCRQKVKLELKSGDQTLGSINLDIQSDYKDLENPQISAQIQGEFFQRATSLKWDLSIVDLGNDLYFRLNRTPRIPNYNLAKIKSQWYKLDLASAKEDIKAEIRNDTDIRKDVSKKLDDILKFLAVNDLFGKINKLPDSGDNYHLQLLMSDQELNEVLEKYAQDENLQKEIVRVSQEAKIDFLVGKKNYFINNFEANVKLANPLLRQDVNIQSQKLEINLVDSLSDINKEFQVTAPGEAKQLASFQELLFLLQPSDKSLYESILGVENAAAANLGSDILFYERLLHLITLLPSSL